MNYKLCDLLESIHIEFSNNSVILIACVLLKYSAHVFSAIDYTSQVFSTKSLVL